MINHARTLLLNQRGSETVTAGVLAEESVPAVFVPLNLPGYLLAVRRVLFGVQPDREFMNYRLQQFMTVLHATPLVDYVLALDPRITYPTGGDTALLSQSLFAPQVTPIVGDNLLTVLGDPAAPDVLGIMRNDFTITVLSSNTIEVARGSRPISSEVVTFVRTSGLSEAIDLPHSGYSFVIGASPASTSWHVSVRNRPQRDLGVIVATLDTVGDAVLTQLFGAQLVEPYRTFRNLWFEQKEVFLRLGALLMAVAYRTEALRRAQPNG